MKQSLTYILNALLLNLLLLAAAGSMTAASYDCFHHLRTWSDEIRAVYPDPEGRIWIGTIHGIMRYGDFPKDSRVYNYDYYPDGTSAALLREAQRESVRLIPNSGIISTVDLVYPHEYYDIHASRKKEIGDRLAYLALAETYRIKGIPSVYPSFKAMTVNGNTAELRFDGIQGGMSPHHDIMGFEAAGRNRKFYPARASADRNTHVVKVTCDSVGEIESVRYCFKNFAIGTLHSTQGLLLVPFRTDKWDK